MTRYCAAVLLAIVVQAAFAARAEQMQIDALLAVVEKSGCEFERNGSRYGAGDGAAHLRMKLDSAGDRVQTAAQFIERIGTGSSQSGRQYHVLCPGQPATTSREWLEKQLRKIQAAGK